MKLLKHLPLHVWLISYLMMFSLGVFLSAAGIFAQSNEGNPHHGKTLFEEHCIECHGRTGDGTGPIGYFLAVQPADLLSVESRMKSDSELFTIIKKGILFDEMHGWEGTLSDQDIYDVVRFIRTLAPPLSQ
jgi:mono/diheme cytochrome c family protein